jgi:small subunit ribosomal protein S19e
VKTSTAKELAPLDDDWLYIRCAAVARRIYLTGHKGVRQLTHMMGSNKRCGVMRNKHSCASQKIIRYCL